MSVIDKAVYVSGIRHSESESLGDASGRSRDRAGMSWVGLYRPDDDEFAAFAAELGVQDQAVKDTLNSHHRPKLARYGDVLVTMLRPARYDSSDERVEFGELYVLTGTDFVVTVQYADSPDLARVRRRMEAAPDLLRLGPDAVLCSIVEAVVDAYQPVVARLEDVIDEIEDQVLAGDPEVSMRIYELFRGVAELQRATHPLIGILSDLRGGSNDDPMDDELQPFLRAVNEQILHVVDRVDGFWVLLQNILTVNGTLVGQRQNEVTLRLTEASLAQNEEIKRISSWAAILFAPTLVGTIYGMNFEHMPELSWLFGYPFALSLMGAVCTSLYLICKRRRWL